MKNHFFSTVVCAAMLFTSNAALAGPDEDMRDAARVEATKLRAQGWPTERCYAGLNFVDDIVVGGNGIILAGDKLLAIDEVATESRTTAEVSKAFDSIPSGGIINVQVRRNGQVINLTQPCGNLAEYQRPYLRALDFAGNKKWSECIDALADRPQDTLYLELRVRCARVSRKPAEYPIQEWLGALYQRSIAMASYNPNIWSNTAKILLEARIDLNKKIYEELVREVIAWDNGKTWKSIQPDYSAMRRTAEQGVKDRLIDPQSAIIEMPYDFIYGSWSPAFSGTRFEGFMTCGTVNAKNRMGGYTGSTHFISVIDRGGFEKYTDMDSSTSEYLRPVSNACSALVEKLNLVENLAPTAAVVANSTNSAKLSLSQELEKLSQLHVSGALSDEEYAAAKARILAEK